MKSSKEIKEIKKTWGVLEISKGDPSNQNCGYIRLKNWSYIWFSDSHYYKTLKEAKAAYKQLIDSLIK